jgi:hypothetical protein
LCQDRRPGGGWGFCAAWLVFVIVSSGMEG